MRSEILFLANIGVVYAELVLAPSNEVVVAGKFMRMTCLTSNNSKVRNWDVFTSNLKPFTIYTPGMFHRFFNHFGVDVDDNGSGVLYTNSTSINDAGIYKCLSIIDGQFKEHSAQLTVLESMPICQANFTSNTLNSSKSLMNGDYIWMQCSISYRGFWIPTMEWIEYGGQMGPEGRTVTEGVELIRIPNRIVTSNLAIVVNSSKVGSRFVCKIYFAMYDGRYKMTASNVPNFTYTWNSSLVSLSISSSESVSATLQTVESSTDVRATRQAVESSTAARATRQAVESSTAARATRQAVESSTAVRATREDLERTSAIDWYLISLSLVAALSVFFIAIIVFVVAFCFRFKKKLAAASDKLEMPSNDGNYDILPYASSDNYDTIDDIGLVVKDVSKVSFEPRQGPLPTPGYSSLTETDSTAPDVYSKIDTYATPFDITSLSRAGKVSTAVETTVKKQVDDSKEKKDGKEDMNLRQEVGLTQSPPNEYIEVFDVVEECKNTSDRGISSSYITVNF